MNSDAFESGNPPAGSAYILYQPGPSTRRLETKTTFEQHGNMSSYLLITVVALALLTTLRRITQERRKQHDLRAMRNHLDKIAPTWE